MWVLRGWEKHAPEGEEPLAWLRHASVPISTLEHTVERVAWSPCRWLVKDAHHCLKSGGRLTHRQRQTVDGPMRVPGLVSPHAVRSLRVRAVERGNPTRPVHELMEPLLLAVWNMWRKRRS